MIRVTINAKIEEVADALIIDQVRSKLLNPDVIITDIHIRGKTVVLSVKPNPVSLEQAAALLTPVTYTCPKCKQWHTKSTDCVRNPDA